MARIPRCALPPVGVYHVTTRGVAKMRIVADDADRVRWSHLFRSCAVRFRWTVFVYCLLDNHFHLVVGALLEDISGGMHRLNGIYAQRFNERHGRVGHLFQERFHAQLIRDEEHLVEACDYVLAKSRPRRSLCDPARVAVVGRPRSSVRRARARARGRGPTSRGARRRRPVRSRSGSRGRARPASACESASSPRR